MTETQGQGRHPALTDDQTGLPNRLHFDTVFDIVFAAGDRGIPLTLIFLEVDRYLEWTTRHGGEAVDHAMKTLGDALATTIRQTDLVARVEEARFAFVLLDCNMAGGRLVVDRLDGLVGPFREETGLKVSIGVAAYAREMDRPYDLIGAAEHALRAAQARGGNDVEFYG